MHMRSGIADTKTGLPGIDGYTGYRRVYVRTYTATAQALCTCKGAITMHCMTFPAWSQLLYAEGLRQHCCSHAEHASYYAHTGCAQYVKVDISCIHVAFTSPDAGGFREYYSESRCTASQQQRPPCPFNVGM